METPIRLKDSSLSRDSLEVSVPNHQRSSAPLGDLAPGILPSCVSLASGELSSLESWVTTVSASLLTGSKVEERRRAIYLHVFSVSGAEVMDFGSASVPPARA